MTRSASWAGLAVLVVAGCRAEPPPGLPLPSGTPLIERADRVAVPGAPMQARPAPRAPGTALTPEEGQLAIEVPPATAGVETTARLRLTANRGYEINEKFHYKLTLDPTPGVSLPETVVTTAEHQDDHELALALKLTAARPGDYTVHGVLNFAVCKIDSQCRPKTMPVAVQVAAR